MGSTEIYDPLFGFEIKISKLKLSHVKNLIFAFGC